MKLRFLPILMLFAIVWQTHSQSTPYVAYVGVHGVKYKSKTNSDFQFGVPRVAIAAPFGERWSVMPSLAIGKIKDPANFDDTFWDFDVSVKYDLTQTKLQPYLVAGLGVGGVKDNTNTILTPGVGLNFWFTEKLGLNLQTNFDHQPDFRDYWHHTASLAIKWGGGPKDSDKDGVPDERDACPKQPGSANAQGCPDGDGDGIKDADDQCPADPGTAATFGCPDSDGDGIANAKDQCPTVAGTTQMNGCPDSDGDGIADKDDACPTVKGIAQFKGCPDSDGDGITDAEDKCPQVKGIAALQGCPDRDGDGITDADDACPDQSGIAANKGCPEIKAEEVKDIETKLNLAAKKIQFETGSAKIRDVSYTEIDHIVAIMNQYSFTKFGIEGHTDNIGDATKNKQLSQDRADAVKAYIMSHGINENRLTSIGYGSEKPAATNNTVAGRAENRRVEIHLKQQ